MTTRTMLALIIIPNGDGLNGEGAWPELKDSPRVLEVIAPMQIARLPGGMKSGESSVCVRIDLPDGRVIIAQTSMKLFQDAARVFAFKDMSDAGKN